MSNSPVKRKLLGSQENKGRMRELGNNNTNTVKPRTPIAAGKLSSKGAEGVAIIPEIGLVRENVAEYAARLNQWFTGKKESEVLEVARGLFQVGGSIWREVTGMSEQIVLRLVEDSILQYCGDSTVREGLSNFLIHIPAPTLKDVSSRISDLGMASNLETLRITVLLLKDVCSKGAGESIERITRILTLEYNKRVCDNAQRVVGAAPDSKASKLRNKMIQQIDKAESIRLSGTSGATSNSKFTGGEMQVGKNESDITASISKSSNIHRSCCPRPHPAPHVTDSVMTTVSKKSAKKPLNSLSQSKSITQQPQPPTTDHFAAQDSLFFRSASSAASDPNKDRMLKSKGTISYLSIESDVGPTDVRFVSVGNRLGTAVGGLAKVRSRSGSSGRDLGEMGGNRGGREAIAALEEKDPLRDSRVIQEREVGIERRENGVPRLASTEQVEEILTDEEREQSQLAETESMIKGEWTEAMEIGVAAEDEMEEIDSFLKHEEAASQPVQNNCSDSQIQENIRISTAMSTKGLQEFCRVSIVSKVASSQEPILPRRQTKEHVHILRYSLPKQIEVPFAILEKIRPASSQTKRSSVKRSSNNEARDIPSKFVDPYPLQLPDEPKQPILVHQSSVSWLESHKDPSVDNNQVAENMKTLSLQASSLLLELSRSHQPLQSWDYEPISGDCSAQVTPKIMHQGQSTEDTKHTVSSTTEKLTPLSEHQDPSPVQRIHIFLDSVSAQPMPIPVHVPYIPNRHTTHEIPGNTRDHTLTYQAHA